MVDVFYSTFNEPIANEHWLAYLDVLPNDLKKRALSYRRWQDRHTYVIGKLLLLQGLSKYGFDKSVFSRIKYTEYGKPFLEEDIDFNISHSGEKVVCAIGKNVQLGIDIEVIEDVDFDDFENVMTQSQWQFILGSDNPIKSFYSLWTMKESVMKADGRGMSIPLLDIIIENSNVHYKGKTWYLNELYFDHDICACLTTNLSNIPIQLTNANFALGIEKVQTSLITTYSHI